MRTTAGRIPKRRASPAQTPARIRPARGRLSPCWAIRCLTGSCARIATTLSAKLLNMRAAVLHAHGEAPRLDDFDDPVAADGHVAVEVAAAGVNHLDLLKASGGFYTGPPPLPSVVGSDGVGRLADGRRVFFDDTVAPHGAMAERTLVREDALLDVPDAVPDELAAALGNSGLGAWLALEWRAALRPGETVLVLGATGAMGSVALQAAKALGAGRVVAAARAGERLQRTLRRGADAVVE